MSSFSWSGRPAVPRRRRGPGCGRCEPGRIAERFELRGCFFEFHGNSYHRRTLPTSIEFRAKIEIAGLHVIIANVD